MEFDTRVTAAAFVAVVLVGIGGTLATPMQTTTVLMMVAPSIVIAGLIFLGLGVKHGEYRARQS